MEKWYVCCCLPKPPKIFRAHSNRWIRKQRFFDRNQQFQWKSEHIEHLSGCSIIVHIVRYLWPNKSRFVLSHLHPDLFAHTVPLVWTQNSSCYSKRFGCMCAVEMKLIWRLSLLCTVFLWFYNFHVALLLSFVVSSRLNYNHLPIYGIDFSTSWLLAIVMLSLALLSMIFNAAQITTKNVRDRQWKPPYNRSGFCHP